MADEELVDYNPEPDIGSHNIDVVDQKKGSYAGIHGSGFRDFLLKSELLHSITDCGFEHPSEVQHECIPQALLGMDVLCQAKSGMGKTAIFVLATLHQLDVVEGEVSVLVLCHTRELAFQIAREYERFSKYLTTAKVEVIYGGVPITQHRTLLQNPTTIPNILVGTPGRVLALVNEGVLKLDKIKHFVLDECDKMLEKLDMRRDVQEIFKRTPHDKQVMMFSATLPGDMRVVSKKFMQNPLEIYVDDDSKLTLHGLRQHYVQLLESEKNRRLNDLLDALEFNQVVIFVSSPSRAQVLNQILNECAFPSTCIHSRMRQEERIEVYQQFKNFQKRILVSTDLFGRGMDIERINIVINYDMAKDADSYLHRVGRAGRFGTKGLAISFIADESDNKVLEDVQSRFEVSITEIPEQIDVSSYLNS